MICEICKKREATCSWVGLKHCKQCCDKVSNKISVELQNQNIEESRSEKKHD